MNARVLLCSYSYHMNEFYLNQRDRAPHYFFRLQMKGSCTALVNNRMEQILEGDLLLFSPCDPFEMRVGEQEGTGKSSADYFIYCDGSWVEQWWSRMNRPHKTRIHPDERLLGVWKQIILEKRRFSQENPEIVLHLLQTLCLMLDRAIMDSQTLQGSKPNAVLKMKSYIEEQASASIRVGDVARFAGLSESRAQHLFKACYGKTIKEYMIEIRLSLAVERMKYSSLTFQQISESLGFNSYVHFHRLFRKKFGMSPSQYMLSQSGGHSLE